MSMGNGVLKGTDAPQATSSATPSILDEALVGSPPASAALETERAANLNAEPSGSQSHDACEQGTVGNALPTTIQIEDSPRPAHRLPRPPIQRQPSALQRLTSEVKARLGGGEHQREWTVFEDTMVHDREQNKAASVSIRLPTNMRSQSSFYADPALNLIDNVSDAPTRAARPVFDESVAHERYDPSEEGEYDEFEEEAGEGSSQSDDEDTQTSESSADGSRERPDVPLWRRVVHTVSGFSLPPLQKNILKCSIACFIASLFTYNRALSHFVAIMQDDGPDGRRYPNPSGHMVATMFVLHITHTPQDRLTL
ncbi:unnamed protein product [Peniophora sp. CBMAI 1063]|nr:unnamed protein product [Peniophora sp. CBMAI 1063]